MIKSIYSFITNPFDFTDNSYHVTSASPSYATQSGPHQQQQSSTGPNSLRTPSSSSASTSQAHPHQDHKMQPQQQQQQSQQPQVVSNSYEYWFFRCPTNIYLDL